MRRLRVYDLSVAVKVRKTPTSYHEYTWKFTINIRIICFEPHVISWRVAPCVTRHYESDVFN